jgi:hypothetical protein
MTTIKIEYDKPFLVLDPTKTKRLKEIRSRINVRPRVFLLSSDL